MHRQIKKLLLFSFSFLISIQAEEALIKKKKQRPAEVKQEIADKLGSIMKCSAELAELNAQLQHKVINAFYDLAEPDDASFFVKATAEQLKLCNQKLSNIQGSLEQSCNQIRYMINNFPVKEPASISSK